MSQEHYPLGILFVHGIGTQRKGETLTAFGGALYMWLDAAKDRGRWRPLERVTLSDARLVAPEDPGAPAHARLTLDPTVAQKPDPTGSRKPVEWLLAESWWAEAFAAPSFGDLAAWGLNIVPWTLGSHFGAHVRGVWTQRTKNAAALNWATALAWIGWLMRFLRAVIGLVASLFLSVGALAALALTLVVALVPISAVRKWLGSIQQVLAASIGDSYTFVVRPFEAAAIVGQVRRDLQWLSDRCDKLVIVAHSQGAAVSFEAIRDDVHSKLRLFFTLGSGLRKLVELKHIMESDGRFQRGALLTLGGLLLAPAAVISMLIEPPAELFSEESAILAAVATISLALLVAGLADFTLGFGRDLARKEGRKIANKQTRWVDCFSTADPVPNGATFNALTEMPSADKLKLKRFSIESCNLCSVSGDHTSYWANLDEFVSIVAAALRLSGVPGLSAITAVDVDQKWLTTISKRRRWRVGYLVAARWLATAGAVAALIRNWPEYAWALDVGTHQLLSTLGLTQAATKLPPMSADAVLSASAVVLAYVAARITWKWWNNREARDLLRYRVPRHGEVSMAMCLGIQAGVAIFIATANIATPNEQIAWSTVLLIAIGIVSSVTERRLRDDIKTMSLDIFAKLLSVLSEGDVAETVPTNTATESTNAKVGSTNKAPYTESVFDWAKNIVLPIVMFCAIISMTGGWLRKRFPGTGSELFLNGRALSIIALIAALSVVAWIVSSIVKARHQPKARESKSPHVAVKK